MEGHILNADLRLAASDRGVLGGKTRRGAGEDEFGISKEGKWAYGERHRHGSRGPRRCDPRTNEHPAAEIV